MTPVLPAVSTDYVAQDFSDVVRDQWIIVARRSPASDPRRDMWRFEWLPECMAKWRVAVDLGMALTAQQKRGDTWLLLGKLA